MIDDRAGTEADKPNVCEFAGCVTPMAFQIRYLINRPADHGASGAQQSFLLCLEHAMLVRGRLLAGPADYSEVVVHTMDAGDDFTTRAAAARAAQLADRLMEHLDVARVAINNARRLANTTHPAFLARVRELCLQQRLERLAEIGWDMP